MLTVKAHYHLRLCQSMLLMFVLQRIQVTGVYAEASAEHCCKIINTATLSTRRVTSVQSPLSARAQ